MAEDFPELADGDALEPWHLNLIFAELRKWRKLRGEGGVTVNGADGEGTPVVHSDDSPPLFIKLTGAYSSGYPWVQVLITPGRVIQATSLVGSTATGDPAFELQTGDTTLTADGTVYEARRSPTSNELYFDGKH